MNYETKTSSPALQLSRIINYDSISFPSNQDWKFLKLSYLTHLLVLILIMTFMQVRGQSLEIPSTNDFNANAFTINDVENTGADAWTVYCQYPGQQDYSFEVVESQFGAYNGGLPIQSFASIVNYYWNRAQEIPSVAGRNSDNTDVFYFYKNGSPNTDDMMYRTAPFITQNLRLHSSTNSNQSILPIDESVLNLSEWDSYRILDLSGRIILSKKNDGNNPSIQYSELPTGIYILQIIND